MLSGFFLYDEEKGGMKLAGTSTSPSVYWRLPTRDDWFLAMVNGMPYVLANTVGSYWTATTNSGNRTEAWYTNVWGTTSASTKTNNQRVRCVGRYEE